MTLTEYLDGMSAATTALELERATHAPFEHACIGSKWSRICKVRIDAGQRICAAHPNGKYVPRLGPRHMLELCGETYRIGYGQNGTGGRYCWHAAEQWAIGILVRHGFSKRACASIWSEAFEYPHRSLEMVAEALAGKLPDPPFNRLILHRRTSYGRPVRVVRRVDRKSRAHRPCECGGWLWDWGAGWNGYANFINWHCDRCPRVYTEYVTAERLRAIRTPETDAGGR